MSILQLDSKGQLSHHQIKSLIENAQFTLKEVLALDFQPIEKHLTSDIKKIENDTEIWTNKHRSQKDLEWQIKNGDLKSRDSHPERFDAKKYPEQLFALGTKIYAIEHLKMLGNGSMTNRVEGKDFQKKINDITKLGKSPYDYDNTYRFLQAEFVKHEGCGSIRVNNIQVTPWARIERPRE